MQENTKYFLISLAAFVLIILVSVLLIKPTDVTAGISIKEEPLAKLREIQLKPGEKYVYVYEVNGTNTTTSLTYAVSQGKGCMLIEVKEAVNRTFVCVDKNGNDEAGSNVTLAKPFFYMFSPWMLAIYENFSWSAAVYANVNGAQVPLSMLNIHVVKKERIFGRDAYLVAMVNTGNGNSETIYKWVDEKKLVLLKEEGPQYNIKITSAPFKLEQ